MNSNQMDVFVFSAVHIIHFILVTANNFYKKEFFKFLPFPLFISFFSEVLMVPLAFFISWSLHHFDKSMPFLKVPRCVWKWLLLSSFVNTLGLIIMNLGLFASDLDFILLFRLTGLVWNGLFGFIFLGERLSFLGLCSLFIVIFGMIFIIQDFEWSTAKFPSTIQICLQLLNIIFHSIGVLITKKVLSVLSQINTDFQLLDFLFWKSFMILPISFFISIFFEQEPWLKITDVLSLKMFVWLVIGTIIHESLHIAMAYVEKLTSMITLGVIGQLRILGTLVISNFAYHQTTWNSTKLIGAALLFAGGALYSVSRLSMNNHSNHQQEKGDEERLISKNVAL